MNVKFDREVDVVYHLFSDADIAESDEDKPSIIIDYNEYGNNRIAGYFKEVAQTRKPRL